MRAGFHFSSSRSKRKFPVFSPLWRPMVDAMEAVATADSAPRRRPRPRQSLRPRRFATGMASFDKAAWRLLSDMTAEVHHGEMIILPGRAVTFRRMTGGSSVAGTAHGHHLLARHLSTAVSLPRWSRSASWVIDHLKWTQASSASSGRRSGLNPHRKQGPW
jgi:hypothetical protein